MYRKKAKLFDDCVTIIGYTRCRISEVIGRHRLSCNAT